MIKIKDVSDRVVKNRLTEWYNESTLDEREMGMNWYNEAQEFVSLNAKKYKISTFDVASVLSALSPNNKWNRNKLDCINVIEAFQNGKAEKDVKVCTFNKNKEKAFNILRGEHAISEKSPKTFAFVNNIALLSHNHVTVDKWHYRACIARPRQGVTNVQESSTNTQYNRMQKITATLASDLGITGYQLQAIIWVTIKRVWGR